MISWANKIAQANASIQQIQADKLMIVYNLDIFAKLEKAISDGIPRHKEIEADPADDFEMTNGEVTDYEEDQPYEYEYDSQYEFDENEDWGFNNNKNFQKPLNYDEARQYVKDVLNSKQTVTDDNEEKTATNIITIDEDFKEIDESGYAVNYNHVKDPIKEFSDDIKTDESDENSSYKLLDILDKIEISKQDLALWRDEFSTKRQARSRMQTVIDYVEKDQSCSKHIKQKLRVITKLIMAKGMNIFVVISICDSNVISLRFRNGEQWRICSYFAID